MKIVCEVLASGVPIVFCTGLLLAKNWRSTKIILVLNWNQACSVNATVVPEIRESLEIRGVRDFEKNCKLEGISVRSTVHSLRDFKIF